MRKTATTITLFVAALVILAATAWNMRWPNEPTAIVLASNQSDTLDGLNGVDPIAPALRGLGYRVYSIDLPCHGPDDSGSGLTCWSQRIEAGETSILSDFCMSVSALIDSTGARRVQMVGVSRGGYVAYECGAQDRRVTDIAQIAPVIDLKQLHEFDGVQLDPDEFSLVKYVDALKKRHNLIRIGRYDDRVSTGMAQAFGAAIGAEVHLLDAVGHRAPDAENQMAKWMLAKWNDWL